MKQVLIVAFLGTLGVLTRFYLNQYFDSPSRVPFPTTTFLINIGGSFLMGYLFILSSEKNILSKEMASALMLGFLGGLTTFSAFSLQTLILLQENQFRQAAFYFIGSPLIGVLAAWSGIACARF
jgi:CrcB protein